MQLNFNTDTGIDPAEKPRKRLLLEMFSSYRDGFEYYLKNFALSRKDIVQIHLTLWPFAILMKLLHNLFYVQIAPNLLGWEVPFKMTDGLVTVIASYIFFFGLAYFTDLLFFKFRKEISDESETPIHPTDLCLLSFLPFSASGLFWLFPRPFNFLFLVAAFSYSAYLFYTSVRIIHNFSERLVLVFFLIHGIILLSFGAVFLTIINLIRM